MGLLAGLKFHVPRFLLWVLFFNLFLDFWSPVRWPGNVHFAALWEEEACSSAESRAAESNTSSGVKVIVAGAQQTGTTSVIEALSSLGWRSYHAEDVMSFARRTVLADVTPEIWARRFSRCRVQAMSIEPAVDLLPVAVAASPDAKVIVTWRDYASWKKSHEGVAAIKDVRFHILMARFVASGIRMLPWLELWDRVGDGCTSLLREGRAFSGKGLSSVREMVCYYASWRIAWGNDDFQLRNRGLRSGISMVTAEPYLTYLSDVRRLVPPERLLFFDFQRHGWRELRAFLGEEDAGRAPREGKLPRARSKHSLTNDTVWDGASWEQLLALLAVFLLAHLVGYAVAWGVGGVWLLSGACGLCCCGLLCCRACRKAKTKTA